MPRRALMITNNNETSKVGDFVSFDEDGDVDVGVKYQRVGYW